MAGYYHEHERRQKTVCFFNPGGKMSAKYNQKLSNAIDTATVKSESGSAVWRLLKRIIEWVAFGGAP